jgi:hypothetical protein
MFTVPNNAVALELIVSSNVPSDPPIVYERAGLCKPFRPIAD